MNLEEARKLACNLDYYDSSGGSAPGEAAEAIREMANEIEKLKAGIESVRTLMGQSEGVYGFHLNGDPAPWVDLEKGGRFEEWLVPFNEAEAI
jgi:hypothetical protein